MRSHRLHRLIICLVAVIVIIVTAIEAVNTVEVNTELKVIKPLPADWNPYQGLYDEMLYPTVRINTKDGIGSGVVININTPLTPLNRGDIYVLTAAHVVENNSSVTVTFYSYHRGAEVAEEIQGSVLITDTNKDLALLRIPPTPLTKGGLRGDCLNKWGKEGEIYSARLAPRDYNYYLFTPVYAIGCSLGLNPRPSSGIITAIHLSGLCVSAVEVSSPILPGNSGGPVFDANTHKVIGIAVWVKTYYGQLITTMGGIVPISEIYEFLDRVQEFNSSRVQK